MKWFFTSLIVIALVSSACSPGVPAQSDLSTPVIDTTSYPTMLSPQSNASQSVSGYIVNLQRAWRDGKQVYADVCFTLPDASDWTIWNANFVYGGQTLSEFSLSMLSNQPATNGQPAQRCDELSFYVPPDADLSAASLTIESLGAPPSEGEYCSLYMPKIQEALNQRGLGITLGCVEVNGVLTMQIVGKPDNMSRDEAEQAVFSDEFYTVKGPWTFQVSLGQ